MFFEIHVNCVGSHSALLLHGRGEVVYNMVLVEKFARFFLSGFAVLVKSLHTFSTLGSR